MDYSIAKPPFSEKPPVSGVLLLTNQKPHNKLTFAQIIPKVTVSAGSQPAYRMYQCTAEAMGAQAVALGPRARDRAYLGPLDDISVKCLSYQHGEGVKQCMYSSSTWWKMADDEMAGFWLWNLHIL